MGIAYIVLVICLVPTLAVYFRVQQNVAARDQARFDQVVRATQEALAQRMERYISALRGVRGLFEASGRVQPHAWEEYVHSIDLKYNYPGMLGLGYAQHVPAEGKETHTAAIRMTMPDYVIRPPGERPEYYPIIYLTLPANASQWSPGWDAFAEPARQSAILHSIDQDEAIATGRIAVKQPDGGRQEPGFLLYLPIHREGARPKNVADRRAAVIGVAFASFSARELGEGIFGRQPNPPIDFEVFDGETSAPEKLLYNRDGKLAALLSEGGSRLERTVRMEGLGRVWSIHFSTLPAFEIDSKRHLPALALLSGLTISLLLFAIAWTQARARVGAERLSASLRRSQDAVRSANDELKNKIAEHERTEKELAAEKEQLAVTLESLAEGVITTDAAGRVVLVNTAAEGLTGWRQEEAAGRPLAEVFQLLDEQTRAACDNPSDRVLKTDGIGARAAPALLRSRRGGESVVVASGAPLHDLAGRILGVVLVFRDVTESRKFEAELNKASKLESLGLLAGGIAHDFNNVLTSILGNISLARMQLPPDEQAQARLEKAEASCLRAKDLTGKLLAFARGGMPAKKTKAIAQLLRDSGGLAVLGSNVRCEFSLPHELWPAEVDSAQITQVLNSILINAVEAMPDGGIVRVSAENIPAGARPGLPSPGAKYVRVSMQDNGPGIPPESLPQIFEPFFTTKHKGRGLGLATAYSIIRKHDGLIEVESKPGKGATFRIFLPATEASGAPPSEVKTRPPTGQGRVLVMDDELDILSFSRVVLKRLGYEVEVARDGSEALNRYRVATAAGTPFSAVILDLTIPGGMGGQEAIRRLLEVDPHVKAIVSSGYSNDPVMAEFQKYGFRGVVAKPYEIRELAKVLCQVIQDPQPATV